MVEKMYNTIQASDLLGIKVRTMRDWISKGKVKAQKYEGSRHWFISESELKRIKGEQ